MGSNVAIITLTQIMIRMGHILRVARIKRMGQAQAAVFTGSSRTAAPRATSGLHGFSAVATEPRGGLSPYLDERVRYRTPPRGPALRAKSARRQCCMTPPAPPPPPAPRTPLPRSPSFAEPIEVPAHDPAAAK